mmetsp:Transcript_11718/g.24132  ORF Transcript_11718/g.24132 Transcript_11718/m.24132 type:complete len:89 (-) Transcript_11718:475-741(-)
MVHSSLGWLSTSTASAMNDKDGTFSAKEPNNLSKGSRHIGNCLYDNEGGYAAARQEPPSPALSPIQPDTKTIARLTSKVQAASFAVPR